MAGLLQQRLKRLIISDRKQKDFEHFKPHYLILATYISCTLCTLYNSLYGPISPAKIPNVFLLALEARSQNCEKRLLASSCLSVRLYVRMEQLAPHWTNFHGILYFSIFRKSVQKFQILSQSDKNDGHFTCRPTYIYDTISLSSF